MAWRLGEIRPINKAAGARPILDEQNSVVALVLLGSETKDRNVEIILRAKEIVDSTLLSRLPDKQPT